MSAIHIALLGLGTVGKGVLETIETHQGKLQSLLGKPVKISAILVKNLDKHVLEDESILLTDQFEEIIELDQLDVVIDVIVGKEPGFTYAKRAIERGCHFITANKEMFAHHGKELLELAEKHGVSVGFEATVAGGIPVIQTLRKLVNVNNITKVEGIINGTSNFILTNMRENQLPFKEVLVSAQEKGYAEADPTNDIEGYDAYFKGLVLSNVVFGELPKGEHIVRKGITHITKEQILAATSLGLKYKHVARLEKQGHDIKLFVEPVLVTETHPFYSVEGVQNAVSIDADIVGNITLLGPGAGKLPTASAVVEDLLHLFQEKSPRVFNGESVKQAENESEHWLILNQEANLSALQPLVQQAESLGERNIYIKGNREEMNTIQLQYPELTLFPIAGEFQPAKEQVHV
ncbi:MAG: homoserine dehydrogenase [Bacillus sp. (in: firmicutes)]